VRMIRLTVLYNLPQDQDEDEFLKWRLGEHQSANMSMEGVVASEFHKILSDATGAAPAYRFLTTVDWPDRESFENGFYDPQVQAGLKENMQKISDPVFLVSECLIRESSDTRRGRA
jgi:hypothetical protein